MLTSKILVLALGVIAYQIFTNKPIPSWRAALVVWNGQDAPWYLNLAEYGYEAGGVRGLAIVFYPLLPWLIRLVGWPLGDYLVGAFIVATVASLVAVVLFDRLVRLDHDDVTSRQATWFFCIFPTSYFFHIGYTEGLFLALTFGTFLAAQAGRWPVVGILGALACLTRVNGLLLLPPLALEAISQYRRTRRLDPGFAWLCFAPLGFGGYLLINYRVTGDPFTFMEVLRGHYHKSFAPPWDGIRAMMIGTSSRSQVEVVTHVWQQALFLVLGVVGAVAAWIRLRPSYAVWIALNLLLFTSTSLIFSVARYSLILFPLPILGALLARRPIWNTTLTVGSLLMLALLVILFLIQLGQAY
jgi:hypothetical protein